MSDFPAELTGSWEIDSVHSTVGFTVKHAMVSTTRGHFAAFTGGAKIDAANPENSELWVEIDATSVNTGTEARDNHLRSPDFWDAENNPKLTFRSTSVTAKGTDLVTVGDLTIKGITKPVEITWEFNGVAKDPFSGALKAGFDGKATINRADWGITWNSALETGGFLISDKVKLVLEVEANKSEA
jgi:polyisoprenoid-binding protein YceI